MERGPLALFGAILAVGLGPAMWLGVQFGQAAGPAARPPTAGVQQQTDNRGGVGAAAPEDPTDIIRTNPKSNIEPLVTTAPKRHRSAVQPSPSPSVTPSEPSATPTSDPTGEQSTPPVENSTAPVADPPSTDGGAADPGQPPPSPPPAADPSTDTATA